MYVKYCENKPKSEYIVSEYIDTYFEVRVLLEYQVLADKNLSRGSMIGMTRLCRIMLFKTMTCVTANSNV